MKKYKISEDQLQKDIISVYNNLNKIPSRNEYDKCGKYYAPAYMLRYGNWKDVILKFFNKDQILQDKRYNYLCATKEEIIKDLIRVSEQTNKRPTQEIYRKYGCFSIDIIYKNCGSFSNILKEAGFPKENNNRKHSKEYVIAKFKKLGQKLNRVPSIQDVVRHFDISISVIRRYFGSLQNLQTICGFIPNKAPNKISNEELLSELKNLKKKLKRAPKQKDITKYGKYSINAYKRAFGGVSKGLILIGEKPNIKLDCNIDEINKEIMKVYNIVKRAPTITDMDKYSNTSYNAIRLKTNFCKWHIILEKAGVSIKDISKMNKRQITNEELKLEIIRLKEKLGRYPNYYDLCREAKFSCNTYEKRFGSFIKAMHGLGFTDYVSQSIYYNQVHTKGLDGIYYKSAFEAVVADYLYNLGKEYQYEKKVCDDRTWTCDFFVDGKWIECDGLESRRKNPYNKNNEKIKYYKENNFNYYILHYRKNVEDQLKKIII